MRNRHLAGFITALAVVPMPALANGPTGPVLTGPRLELAARGEVTRVPDLATINAGVVTQATDARAAIAANAQQMDRVLTALTRAGIAARDVATARVSLQPQYRYAENQPPVITGYQASNTLTIRFRDVARSGGVLDALVTNGVNQIDGPNLSVDRPDAALDEARASAMAILRTRAMLYARLAGTSIKRLVELSESTDAPSPRPYMMMARSASSDSEAKTQIAPGESTLAVTVRAVFELN